MDETAHDHGLSEEAHRRLQRFKTYAISHTMLADIAKELKRAIVEPAGFSHVLLFGPSGVGKTTLMSQMERTYNASPRQYDPRSSYLPVPLLLLEARPPDGVTFNRTEYYKSALRQLGEVTYKRETVVSIDQEQLWGHKPDRSKGAKFHDSTELRHVYEDALQRRGVRSVVIDEAQHMLKLASGMKLIDQLDWVKSMTNTTGVLHILTGTYELLAMRKLNGQTARRGLELHFPRYHYQHQPDQLAFQSTLVTLLNQVPLEVNIDDLAQYWPYFYERSIGCVGVLKDWLVRAVNTTLLEGEHALVFERIQECALPLAQCESMALDATAGEQELHYTASQRQHLWKLLGMNDLTGTPTTETHPEPAPASPPPHRTGEQHPVRQEVGETKSQMAAGKCNFSGQEVEISLAELEQVGVAKLQCPECGAVWTAKMKGGKVYFANHAAPTRKRSQAIPRWMKLSTRWTFVQR
jgi:DNA polymerase III delta prime subunit